MSPSLNNLAEKKLQQKLNQIETIIEGKRCYENRRHKLYALLGNIVEMTINEEVIIPLQDILLDPEGLMTALKKVETNTLLLVEEDAVTSKLRRDYLSDILSCNKAILLLDGLVENQ